MTELEETNKIGSLIGQKVAWHSGTGEVIIHEKDDVGREMVRLKPLTGKQFPTDHFVKDIEVY